MDSLAISWIEYVHKSFWFRQISWKERKRGPARPLRWQTNDFESGSLLIMTRFQLLPEPGLQNSSASISWWSNRFTISKYMRQSELRVRIRYAFCSLNTVNSMNTADESFTIIHWIRTYFRFRHSMRKRASFLPGHNHCTLGRARRDFSAALWMMFCCAEYDTNGSGGRIYGLRCESVSHCLASEQSASQRAGKTLE